MDEEGSDLFPPRKNFYYGGKKMITERIQAELHALGITPCYRGYEQLACAVELAVSNEADLKDITKRIYWVVAEKCGCKRSCVERNIRTVIFVAWHCNRARLRMLARYPLNAPPTASKMIAILVKQVKE